MIPTDDDGDPIEYIYRWLVDGVEDPGLTTAVVDSLETNNLETWTCEVTPTDGIEEGPLHRTDTVSVSDGSAPPPPDVNPPSAHRNKDAARPHGLLRGALRAQLLLLGHNGRDLERDRHLHQ